MPKAKLEAAEPAALQSFYAAADPEMVGRNCRLLDYDKKPVPSFKPESDFIAYASPDSTFAVTKRLLEAAQRSIMVNIYDFTAGYVKELLLKKMHQGVKVTLKVDLDNRSGETELWDELIAAGVDGTPSPSCASQSGAKYFASSHEKVIVIDDEWTLVQSGNYSDNSIPMNDKDGGDPDEFVPGNRDMGIAIKDKKIAAYFEKLFRGDIELERAGGAEGAEFAEGEEAAVMLERAPAAPPTKLFASKPFNPKNPVKVQAIISPDNYMSTIPDWLESADKSIYIEQQYIRGHQEAIGFLLSKIQAAMQRNPKLDVRIVLAKPFPGKRFDKEADAIKQLKEDFGLKLGENIRILNPRHFVHCHNKLIVVDEQAVLISSQNWSDSAVTKNREAGLLLEYPELAKYYSAIFKTDWDSALKTVSKKAAPEFLAESAANSGVRTVELNWGDYAEV